jgi:histidyl-tRNA synthetase
VCRPQYRRRLVDFLIGVESALCSDCRERTQKNPLRTLDCKVERCRQALVGAPSILDHLCPTCSEHFSTLRRTLKRLDISFNIDPRLVRGLDYYTRTAFEYTSPALGAQNAVAGGGRYDGLVRQLGGPQLPAFGFAVGMERLLLALDKKIPPGLPRVFLAHIGEGALEEAVLLLRNLRREGISAEMIHDPKSLKAQMKLAGRSGADFTLIMGEEELKENRIVLRNMRESTQETILRQELINRILNIACSGRT